MVPERGGHVPLVTGNNSACRAQTHALNNYCERYYRLCEWLPHVIQRSVHTSIRLDCVGGFRRTGGGVEIMYICGVWAILGYLSVFPTDLHTIWIPPGLQGCHHKISLTILLPVCFSKFIYLGGFAAMLTSG